MNKTWHWILKFTDFRNVWVASRALGILSLTWNHDDGHACAFQGVRQGHDIRAHFLFRIGSASSSQTRTKPHAADLGAFSAFTLTRDQVVFWRSAFAFSRFCEEIAMIFLTRILRLNTWVFFTYALLYSFICIRTFDDACVQLIFWWADKIIHNPTRNERQIWKKSTMKENFKRSNI